ncbi:hypothetical protein Pla110_25770 [Polystyrenella longa]|uniref:Uncharacterized protein n=1 Tax=Polystyrenella longa TaxID=2528007 RepID=A0A518CNN3_9PLAN|nr:hypothetical protein [Polystyrenella longa]QDU80841.1 hypothetical protein Pla110_25770 [Polystyrenella longa]
MNTFAALMPYSRYVDMLSRDLPGVFWKLGLLLILGLLFVASGVYLPMFLSRKKTTDTPKSESDQSGFSLTTFVSLSLLGGIANCLLWWLVSYHITKSMWPGMIATLPLTGWGIYQAIRHCPCDLKRTQQTPLIVVTLIALILGIWHFGPVANELPPNVGSENGPKRLIPFNDLYGDVGSHVLASSLIQEYGLPLVDVYGSPENKFSAFGYVGHSTLISGCASLTQQDPYIVSCTLWILAYLMTGWLALCCVERYQFSSDIVIAAGIVPLFWGQIDIPNFRMLFTPSTITNFQGLQSSVSGMQYHNFSQALSVVFGLGFLFCYQGYQESSRSTRWWLAGLLCLIVSAWINPTLFVLLTPALLICMILNRSKLSEWITFVGFLAFGLFIYSLSKLFDDVPSGHVWFLTVTHEQFASEIIPLQWIPFLKYWGFALGVGLILIVFRAKTLLTDLKSKQFFNWADLILLATLGSLLFALLFRETADDAGYSLRQPYLGWGITGSITTLSCFLVVWLARDTEWREKLGIPSWLRTVGIVLVTIQLLNGIIYSVVYPLSYPRIATIENKELLISAYKNSSAGDRFMIDPDLLEEFVFKTIPTAENVPQISVEPQVLYDLVPYLQRPVAMNLSTVSAEERRNMEAWFQFCRRSEPEELLTLVEHVNQRNALIIKSNRISAQEILQVNGWSKKTDLSDKYQLWLRKENPNSPAEVESASVPTAGTEENETEEEPVDLQNPDQNATQ